MQPYLVARYLDIHQDENIHINLTDPQFPTSLQSEMFSNIVINRMSGKCTTNGRLQRRNRRCKRSGLCVNWQSHEGYEIWLLLKSTLTPNCCYKMLSRQLCDFTSTLVKTYFKNYTHSLLLSWPGVIWEIILE